MSGATLLIPGRTQLLLVEDDDGDAFLVQELLGETGSPLDIIRTRTVGEALTALAAGPVTCVLLDLGLPDAEGLGALHDVIAAASPHTAVICLTGLADEHRGMAAVAAGAQDYLVKGQVDGYLLLRAIRYAVERRRADEQARQLYVSQARAEENARLERGLLPMPQVRDSAVAVTPRYLPGRGALLGGDFYDVVETEEGLLHVLIGDVAGHGPDEAALGVCLRIAWRTLVLSGVRGARVLEVLQEVLVRERRSDEVFTTLAMMVVGEDRRAARMWLAGHPAPLALDPAPSQLDCPEIGPALGLLSEATWEACDVELPARWRLLLFTDGLVEGHVGDGTERLGVSGMLDLLAAASAEGADTTPQLLDEALRRVQALNGGPLPDDVAMLVVAWPAGEPTVPHQVAVDVHRPSPAVTP